MHTITVVAICTKFCHQKSSTVLTVNKYVYLQKKTFVLYPTE